MKDLKRAMHKDDPRWYQGDGYAWAPRSGEEKGPPGWLGHIGRGGAPLQEALPGARPGKPFAGYDYISGLDQPKPEAKKTGVLHFHHPNWEGWKKMKHTHVIGKDGTPGKLAAATPKAQPAAEPKPKVKAKAEVEPTVDPKAGPKKDATGLSLEDLAMALKGWLAKHVGKIPDWDGLFKLVELTDEQKKFLGRLFQKIEKIQAKTKTTEPAGTSTTAAEPEGDDAWVGKTMREVVKLTKAELKRLGFRKQRMIQKKQQKYPNKRGPAWMWGGLMRLKRKHPLRRKYSKWYKHYYSAAQRKRRRDARRAKKK